MLTVLKFYFFTFLLLQNSRDEVEKLLPLEQISREFHSSFFFAFGYKMTCFDCAPMKEKK